LGIILRSTNTRNAFEIYDPLLRLAKRLLGDDTVLILSSEWEFVPFTNPSVFGGVPNCTVVGLPVMEAANVLVTPLAGHELGHAVWQSRAFNDSIAIEREHALCEAFRKRPDEFKKYTGLDAHSDIGTRLAMSEWGQFPLDIMQNVCEELFCDMLGVRLFGMGYLYAFEYLAAPSLGTTDLQQYPALDARAIFLVDALNKFISIEGEQTSDDTASEADPGTEWPRLERYASRFIEEPQRGAAPQEQFLLDSAHQACESLVPRLREVAAKVCGADGAHPEIAVPTLDRAMKARHRIQNGLPAVADLADLVNAGWLGYLDPDFWRDVSQWRSEKFRLLNELVFKSLDVTEFTRS
jgi:hypothetical protein